jgi:hypothetical protein
LQTGEHAYCLIANGPTRMREVLGDRKDVTDAVSGPVVLTLE